MDIKGSGITRAEWLTALKDATGESLESDDTATAIDEFAIAFGLGRCAAQRRLEEMVRTGYAIRTQKWGRIAHGTRKKMLVAYKLVTPKKIGPAKTARRARA